MSKGRYFCGGSLVAVTLALGVGAPVSAFAQDAQTAFQGADANGDLILSQEEIANLPEQFRDNAVDRDGNGQVSFEEYNAAAQAAPAGTTVNAVVAVGSRIRGNAEAQALPVEVIGRAEFEARGNPSTESVIRDLSEVGNVQGQSARGTNAGGYGVSSINLRNLGSGRTLLTLNGRRLADDPNTNGGGANVTGGAQQNANAVPMEVLTQMEILKDGGGATYGADAVGGVVNFVTRRDLDGFEVRTNYSWKDASASGDYDVNVQWGKQREDGEGDILVSFFYGHQEDIVSGDVDYIRDSVGNFYSTGITSPAFSGQGGAYWFVPQITGATTEAARLASLGSSVAIRPTGAGVANYANGGSTDPITGRPTVSASGLLRDDACLRIGGYRSWSSTGSPQCSYNRLDLDRVQDDQDAYRLFGSTNFNINERFRYHGEALFNKTVITVFGLELGMNTPCDPIPEGAVVASRLCTRVAQSTVTSNYSVPGYNPAVRDYVLRYYNTSDTTRVFTDAQIASLTGAGVPGGCTGTIGSATQGAICFNGGTDGIDGDNDGTYVNSGGIAAGAGTAQGYIPTSGAVAGANPLAYGRVILGQGFWYPWAARRNPAFTSGQPTFKNQSQLFRTTQELQGDLGSLFGNQVDFTLSATYSRNITQLEGQGMLTDRLQRALNGYGTDYSNFGGDGCSARDTVGTRTYTVPDPDGTGPLVAGTATVTGVPFTTGAGGGAGDAEFGFNPGAAAGNGCFFFNPFASSIDVSLLNGETPLATDVDVGFVSASTGGYGGITGDYQGYAPGLGLQNSPGLVRWLYEYRENRSQSDSTDIELTFNGQVEDYELPGGPIQWAAGGQYRYTHRSAFTSRLNDSDIHPCPFLSQEQGVVNADSDNVNGTSTCLTETGPFSPSSGVTGDGYRESVTHAVFAELSLPFLRNLNGTLRYRYEESKQAETDEYQGASVVSGGLKYTVNPNFAVAVDLSQTFDVPSIPAFDTDSFIASDNPTTGDFFGNADNVNLNPGTRVFQVTNTQILPESGFNYTVRLLFQSRDRRFTANIDYWNILVSGRPVVSNASTIGRALTGNTEFGGNPNIDQIIDCNSPAAQQLFNPNFAPNVLGGPFVSYVDSQGNPVFSGACLPNTTLRGVDADGGDTDLDGNAYNDGGDFGLFIRTVDRINSGDQHSSGIDVGADFRIPRDIFGGQLSLSADASWQLTLFNADVFLFGIPVTESQDNIGIQAAGFAAQGNIWRGSIGATYRKGRHQLSVRGVYIGATADRAIHGTDGATAPAIPSNNFYNLNPIDPTACDNPTGNGLPLPYLPMPVAPLNGPTSDGTPGGTPLFVQAPNVGDRENVDFNTAGGLDDGNLILVGEQNLNANCNLPQPKGTKVGGGFVMSATYRLELPRQTVLSLTVDNLLDTDPPFMRYQYGYSPYSSAIPYGRTFRVGLSKKFGAAPQ